jgi:MFS superfamily sulfate permease-like transporter
MLSKISKNGVALILLLAMLFNLDIDEVLAESIVSAITLLVSIGLMIWNQIDRKDLRWGLFRK